jgi:spore maturation protein CgeB
MKILYHIRFPEVNAAERWIFEAWRDGFTVLGHQVELLTAEQDLDSRLRECVPDLFMTDIVALDLRRDLSAIAAARSRGTKVAVWIHWPLTECVMNNDRALREEDVADVYFGEREADHDDFRRDTGKEYHCIPHAASPVTHLPEAPREQYACDILYIGTRLPLKRWFEDNVLRNLMADKTLRVRVVGLGWEALDLKKRVLRRVFKMLGLARLRSQIEKSTVKIAPEDERFYYASAKICLNFHERDPDGAQPHYIVNQRTFKIPACNGFQICDDVPAIRRYFNDDEIVLLPLDSDLWLTTIRRFLADSKARERIRINGMRRVQRDHMAQVRCESIIHLAGLSQADAPMEVSHSA